MVSIQLEELSDSSNLVSAMVKKGKKDFDSDWRMVLIYYKVLNLNVTMNTFLYRKF